MTIKYLGKKIKVERFPEIYDYGILNWTGLSIECEENETIFRMNMIPADLVNPNLSDKEFILIALKYIAHKHDMNAQLKYITLEKEAKYEEFRKLIELQ